MNNILDRKACYQAYVVLKELELLDELPNKVKTQIISNGDISDNSEKFSFDQSVPLFEQIDYEKTKVLLSYLYLKYINKNEEEKNVLLEKYKQNEINFQNEMREKYSVAKLFKKAEIKADDTTSEKKEYTELVEYKKANVFKKLFDRIKSFINGMKNKWENRDVVLRPK